MTKGTAGDTPESLHAWQQRRIDADPKKREALRLVEVFLAKQAEHRAALRSGDPALIERLAVAMEEARAAATGADPHPTPRVADVLAANPVVPGDLIHAIASRLPSVSAPASVRRAPRQVVRVVLRASVEVGCGGFGLFLWNARGWFRVAGAAFAAMGREQTATLVRAAWKVAESERATLRHLDYPEYARETKLQQFDDEGWRLIAETMGEPFVAYVRAHEDDFLDLDHD